MKITKRDREFLHDYLSQRSPTGFEHAGQKCWLKQIKKYASNFETDAYGNAWAMLEGSAEAKSSNAKKKSKTSKASKKLLPNIMLEAHADEIGYMVKYITDDGFIKVDIVGGSDSATARGKQVDIIGDKGIVKGIIGNTAIHIRENRMNEKAPKVHELFVDIGAKDKKEVAKAGVRIGCPMVYTEGVKLMDKRIVCGRALDNRMGGFILTQIFKALSAGKTKPAWNVYAVNAVQEEIGGNGAKMITHKLNPDIAIVFDVTHATDTPGIDKNKHGSITLGGGPSVTHGSCNHPNMVRKLIDIAEKSKIKLQMESSSRYSGTDTDSIFTVRDGIPSALISVPLRYMHSTVEMVDFRDVAKAIDLTVKFVQALKAGEYFAVKI